MRALIHGALPVATFFCLAACGDTDSNNSATNNGPGLCFDISGNEEVGGLSIKRPVLQVNGCKEVPGPVPVDPEDDAEAFCEEIAPDLSCVGQSEPLGTPIMVTFTGCVASFGLDAQSDGLTVTLMKETVGGTKSDPGYDLNGPAGAQTEKTPGALVGHDPDDMASVGHVQSKTVPRATCLDLGQFSMAQVPTETQLIARVTDQNVEKARRQYVDTYQYNVLLRNDAIREGPTEADPFVTDPATYCAANPCYVIDDLNTVFETTFKTIALTAGVSRIVGDDDLYDGSGQGHIAGAVQDCTSENTMQNAVIGIDTPVKKLAYFNVSYPPAIGNLEDPKVDQSRRRTNADGLYAAIAADTQDGGQSIEIGAVITRSVCGQDGICQCKDDGVNPAWSAADTDEARVDVLGRRTIFVYPDSITILTFDRNLYTTQ
jgi:hypothetical protein